MPDQELMKQILADMEAMMKANPSPANVPCLITLREPSKGEFPSSPSKMDSEERPMCQPVEA
jgi:hypothetical protein